MEADISALTNPNKKQAVCYPASAGGGDKEEERKKEGGGRVAEQERGGSVPASPHLSAPEEGNNR